MSGLRLRWRRSAGRRRRPVSLAAMLLALLAAGIAPPAAADDAPPLGAVVKALRADLPGLGLELEERIRIGRIKLGLLRGLLSVVPDEDGDAKQARRLLAALSRVEVRTYGVEIPPGAALPAAGGRLDEALSPEGWSVLVRERGRRSASWVLAREEPPGTVAEMLVVDLTPGELELVRLSGRLDELLAAALEGEDPIAALP